MAVHHVATVLHHQQNRVAAVTEAVEVAVVTEVVEAAAEAIAAVHPIPEVAQGVQVRPVDPQVEVAPEAEAEVEVVVKTSFENTDVKYIIH